MLLLYPLTPARVKDAGCGDDGRAEIIETMEEVEMKCWRATGLLAIGALVVRSAGSKGQFDLVALFQDHVELVQVKFGKKAVKHEEKEALATTWPNLVDVWRSLWVYLGRGLWEVVTWPGVGVKPVEHEVRFPTKPEGAGAPHRAAA